MCVVEGTDVCIDYGAVSCATPLTVAIRQHLSTGARCQVETEGMCVRVRTPSAHDATRVPSWLYLAELDFTPQCLTREHSEYNLMLHHIMCVGQEQAPLAGTLSNWLSRRVGARVFDQCETGDVTHEVSVSTATEALRAAHANSRELLSHELRDAAAVSITTSKSDSVLFDNDTSLLPVALSRPLSEARFGHIKGRRSPSYRASWTYVPVVFDHGTSRRAVGCMDVDVLRDEMTWFTSGDSGRSSEAQFAWVPIPPFRDSVSRLATKNGNVQCQHTWTQMGTQAHERLRAYDLLVPPTAVDTDFEGPPIFTLLTIQDCADHAAAELQKAIEARVSLDETLKNAGDSNDPGPANACREARVLIRQVTQAATDAHNAATLKAARTHSAAATKASNAVHALAWGASDDTAVNQVSMLAGMARSDQFVSQVEGEDGRYRHPVVDMGDIWPSVVEYAWRHTGDSLSLVRAFADNAYHGLRVALRHPRLLRELLGDASPDDGDVCLRNIGPEYPVLWPFGAQSTMEDGPRRVHETRADAIFHLSPANSTTGVVLLVEYKTHMELASRAVSGTDGHVASIYRQRTNLCTDAAGALNMFNGVAGNQTDQHRQAETNAWLLYLNTGLLPTHCIIVHTTRRQRSRATPLISAVDAGAMTPGEPHCIPCCIVAVRRLDMRQQFMRALLNVMLCGMYRGGQKSKVNVTSYCDRFYVVPAIDRLLDQIMVDEGDEQIAQLNQLLPRSILPVALGLACAACDERWPAARDERDACIFGPGAPMPTWITKIQYGRVRVGDARSTRRSVVARLANRETQLRGTSELMGVVTSRDDVGYLMLCEAARFPRSDVDESCIMRDGQLVLVCRSPGQLVVDLRAHVGTGSALTHYSRHEERASYPLTEPDENMRLRAKLRSDTNSLVDEIHRVLVSDGVFNGLDEFDCYSYTVVASHLLHACVDFSDIDELVSAIGVISNISEVSRAGIDRIARVYSPSGRVISFTGTHKGDPDHMRTSVLRAVQRTLNHRLLCGLAAAHGMSNSQLLDRVPVIPARGVQCQRLTEDEFVHRSDRGTLSGELLHMATNLHHQQATPLVWSVGRDVCAAIQGVWRAAQRTQSDTRRSQRGIDQRVRMRVENQRLFM